MDKNRRSLDLQNASSPPPDENPRTILGAGRALAGVFLTTLGLVIALVGAALIHGFSNEIPGKGATTAGMLALVGGFLTLGLGLLLLAAGVFLLGKRGKTLMTRFGCLLFFGGIATYLGDLILNQGPNKVARLVGLLAALLGIIVLAAARGWLTDGQGGIFDD